MKEKTVEKQASVLNIAKQRSAARTLQGGEAAKRVTWNARELSGEMIACLDAAYSARPTE